jgi:hypothetical protein
VRVRMRMHVCVQFVGARMGTIGIGGSIFHGVHCGDVGVYTSKGGSTYAGAHEAHGYGVVTGSDGTTYSGQLANGKYHGHAEAHWPDGDVTYSLYEHDGCVHCARVERNGACEYDHQPCGADHAGHVALKAAAQQAAVRIRPIPASPQPRPQRPRRGRNRGARAVACLACSILVPA